MRNSVLAFALVGLSWSSEQLLRAQTAPIAVVEDPPVDTKFRATAWTWMQSFTWQLGAGPHGTVLLLHGLPGYESNVDLAQSIRRAGWNVLLFHYRGTWGTAGTFTQSGAIEDTAEAVRFLRDPAKAEKYRSNPKRMVIIGHSLGGFLAGYEATHDSDIMAVAIISAVNLGKGNADAEEREVRLKRWA